MEGYNFPAPTYLLTIELASNSLELQFEVTSLSFIPSSSCLQKMHDGLVIQWQNRVLVNSWNIARHLSASLGSATLGATRDLVPTSLPLFSPSKWSTTDNANLFGQV
jgi:hypothetical protein